MSRYSIILLELFLSNHLFDNYEIWKRSYDWQEVFTISKKRNKCIPLHKILNIYQRQTHSIKKGIACLKVLKLSKIESNRLIYNIQLIQLRKYWFFSIHFKLLWLIVCWHYNTYIAGHFKIKPTISAKL